MLLNRFYIIVIALLLACAGCTSNNMVTKEVCPILPKQSLQFVDVFDGTAEEMAMLIPDNAQGTDGYWLLGYVYDATRFVTIRCKYADGKTIDVKLLNKVERCDYKIDIHDTLTLACK